MKLLRLHSALALTMAGALAFGCSGGDDNSDDVVIRDSGPNNTTPDAGMRDGGGGGGPVCGDGVCENGMNGTEDKGERFVNCSMDCPAPDFCPDGTEGCECSSTFTPGDTSFGQDDCVDADNLCIPWDVLSGRGMEVMLPDQTCVKTCATDADCGANRFCKNMDFQGASASVGSICVDRLAGIDEYCGASKNTAVLVTNEGADVKTDDEQVGCAGDAVCLFNALGELNPDEGACVQLCGRAGDANCPAEFPYCNPGLLEVDTSTAGLCSVGRLGFGAWGGFTEDPNLAGFASICDQADPADLVLLGLQVIGIPAGVCIEECNSGGTSPDQNCVSTDATNPVECVVLDAATGDGVCIHTNVEQLPDTCGGGGSYGNGRTGFGVVFGDARIPANWCVDRLDPVLTVSSLSTAGQLSSQGDNCAARPLDEYRCPDPTLCAGDGAGNGVCLVGCSIVNDPTYCEDTLTALGLPTSMATCVMTGTSTVVGLCGGD